MKKALGQIKRGVNKKVLKVPGIEQKVLDATNNDSWGPHGSLLEEIANASRNHHEYQLTLGVLWKRLSDTGKNWRHVYKALTVLEYLVGHGSERVIEEIKERAYQISTLSSFQYIDSSGRDQGINVRKKAQSLVALVNDKERIVEVREKAAANRERYHNSTVGGMHRPPGGYGDKYDYEGRYENRDEARSSYGREREYGYTDDDRNSRDGDRYSRDSEDRYGRDGNRDDEYRGRSRSVDNYQHGSRGRSSDREQPIEDDGQSSSRGSGARADDHSQGGRGGLERKFSEQNIGASPPSYEDAVSESRSPVYSERDGGETPQVTPPGAVASPPAPAEINSVDNKAADFVNGSPPQHVDAFDEFDPRGSFSACAPTAGASVPPTVISTSAPPASNNAEMDLLGSLSDVFSPNPLAVVTSDPTSYETRGQANTGTAPSFSTSLSSTQPFDDPFGDSPFKAITSAEADPSQHQSLGASFQSTPPTSNHDNGHPFGFGEAFAAVPNHELDVQDMQAPLNSSVLPQEQFDTSEGEIDILAGILPPSGPPVSLSPQPNSTVPTSQFPPNGNSYESYHHQAAPTEPNMSGQTPFGQASQHYSMVSHFQNHPEGMQFNNGGFTQQPGYASSANSQHPQYTPGLSQHPPSESFPHQPTSATSSSSQTTYATTPNAPAGQFDGGNFMSQQPYGTPAHIPQQTQSGPVAPAHIPQQTQSGPQAYRNNNNVLEDMHQPGSATSSSSQTSYAPTPNATAGQFDGGNFMTQQPFGAPAHIPQQTQSGPVAPAHIPQQTQSGPQAYRNNNNVVEDMHQPGSASSSSSQTPFATTPNAPPGQFDGGNFMTQQPYGAPAPIPQRTHSGPVAAYGNNSNVVEDRHQPGSASSSAQTPYSNMPNAPAGQFGGGNFMTQQAYGVTQQVHGVSSHIPQRTLSGPAVAQGNSNNVTGDMFAPAGPSSLETSASQPSLTPSTGAIEIAPQPQKKFEPKSAIWADTLSKGLVNFNISGPKTNPLADIGVDFAAINRKEKRLEKPSAAQQQQVTSTINMGKAMGSGTGLGRAGASAMRPPTNSMVGSSMPTGMNVGGYGGMMNQNHPMGMNQHYNMGMNQNHQMGMNQNHHVGMNQNHQMGMNQNHPMGMNQNYAMGMGMNMNMGGYGQGPQGYPMQSQQGMNMAPPGQQQGMTGAYNPMMGQGGYNPHQQQPYGGGYR